MLDLEFTGSHLEYLVGKGYQYYLFVVTGQQHHSGDQIVHVRPFKTEEEALQQKEASPSAAQDYIHDLHTSPGHIVDATTGGVKGQRFIILNIFEL